MSEKTSLCIMNLVLVLFPPSSSSYLIRNPSCRLIEHAWHLLDKVECHLLVLHHNCLGNEKKYIRSLRNAYRMVTVGKSSARLETLERDAHKHDV